MGALVVVLKVDAPLTVNMIATRTVLDGVAVPSAGSTQRDPVKPTVDSTVWERLVQQCVLMHVLESALHVSTRAASSVEHVLRCALPVVVLLATSHVQRTALIAVMTTVFIRVLKNAGDALISATRV